MRMHIVLDDELVRELDRRVGPRRRSSFIARALNDALADQRRWEALESAVGSVPDGEHEWDPDPAAWVRGQRHGDDRRIG